MRIKIDELAQRTGTTSRNIRAYQGRGLLPPPHLEGRTGYYDEEHLRRLEIIDDLQQRGFSLEAIRQILEVWERGGDIGHLIGFQHLIAAPFSDEVPETHDIEMLFEAFPDARGSMALVLRAVELGVIELGEDGRTVVVPSPMILEAGSELSRIGVPLAALLDLVEALQADVQDMSDRFLQIVADYVLEPLVNDPDAADRFGDVLGSLERLRPVALEIARPFLARAMRTSIDRTLQDFSAQLDPGSD